MASKLSELRKLLSYDEETGAFHWKAPLSNRVKTGDLAGYVTKRGYRVIGVAGEQLYAHQLAWLFTYGKWPHRELDHINRNHDNNWSSNLRLSDRTQQLHNTRVRKDNTSGTKGVSWHKDKWDVYINVRSKRINLGRYEKLSEAIAARAAGEAHYKDIING